MEAREAIEGPDEDDEIDTAGEEPGILDEAEWADGDGFKPDQGVR